MAACFCGTNINYSNCCGVFIEGRELPATPEQLMRSRYSAYAQANVEYIQQTMLAPANINYDPESAREWAMAATWQKLEVMHSSQQGDKGFVKFSAHFAMNGQELVIDELSEFDRVNGKWFYVNGKGPDNQPQKTKKIEPATSVKNRI
jgi:SEC-C motif-containing protein